MNNGTTLLTFLENNKSLLINKNKEANQILWMKLPRFKVDCLYNYFVFAYIPRIDISCITSNMQLISIYDMHFDYTKKTFNIGDGCTSLY